MRAPVHLRRAILVLTFLVPQTAAAANGLYAGLSLGYGSFSGNRLIISDTGMGDRPNTEPGTCCPKGGLEFELRLGYSLFAAIAPEFVFIGHGWDIGSDAGGAGFIGGGLRAFPLGFMNL